MCVALPLGCAFLVDGGKRRLCLALSKRSLLIWLDLTDKFRQK